MRVGPAAWPICIALPLLMIGLTACGADEPSFSAAQIEFFEKSVRPLLATRCYECHGAEKQEGSLRLDHRSLVLKGGDGGAAAVVGKPFESLLVEAINYESYEMPPTGKLSADEIAVLTRWIEMGLPWPVEEIANGAQTDDFDLEARKQHWSFQPINPSTVPVVADESWPRDAIDRFVLARLDEAGLQPATDADKRTLIRRIYLDLIGLPPPAEKVADFLADDSPRAFETVVDELLSSSHFGERWGRHWLDLVRYGETLGHEFDYPLQHAWRYRDYVVRAFNADVPYDDFVREHVAGDLLANPRRHATEGYNESIIGTGFWHLHEDVHAPVDVRLAEANRYDNQIDVFSKALLGLTVACARCHDHKFDPITAADYYALAGFLKSSRRQEAFLDPRGDIAATTATIQELREAAEALGPSERLRTSIEPPREGEVIFEAFDGGSFDGWYASGWAFGEGPTQSIADSRRLAKPLAGALRSKNFTIEHDAVWIRVAGEKGRIRLVVDGYQMDVFSALLFKELTQTVDTKGEWTWLRIGGDLPNHKGHRAYFELLDDGEGWLAVDEIRLTDRTEAPAVELVELQGAGRPLSRPSPPAPLPRERGVSLSDVQLVATDEVVASAGQNEGNRAEAARLNAEADRLAATLSRAIPVHAMQDGPACDEELFIRGNHEKTAGPVPRRFLEAFSGNDDIAFGEDSGRLALAERVLSDDNPFPARVMVNRVWQHLFGEGIVRSVDNFGVLGEAPSHPELLDHLAESFREDGWSTKRLIRRIVLSRSYQMASVPHPETAERIAEVDPTNRLLHSQRIKRLEGEAIRDAILAVSGRLDATIGGESVPVHLTAFMQGRGRPGESGPLDGMGRRSLYIKVQRNFLTPMLTAFDFPPPATTVGRRNVSNVPAQALILLNDPFVVEQADVWARRALAERSASPEERIQRLYEAAYGREATSEEVVAAVGFLRSDGGDWETNEAAWGDLCHVLLNGKEFVFVR